MPIYTYRCENCGIQFDRRQKFEDVSLTVCPECEEKTLRKVFQPVGILFKGSGFYATDNRSPSGTHRSGSKSENESGEAAIDTKKKDTETSTSPSTTSKD